MERVKSTELGDGCCEGLERPKLGESEFLRGVL
jgi:hypothetical protein